MRRVPALLDTSSPAATSGYHRSRLRHDPFPTIGVSYYRRLGRQETRSVGLERHAGNSCILHPCMPRHRGRQQRRSPFLRVRRALRATMARPCVQGHHGRQESSRKGTSYIRIQAGDNSAEFQATRLDTATRARARHTRAPRSLRAWSVLPLIQAVLRHDQRPQPRRPVGPRRQGRGRC